MILLLALLLGRCFSFASALLLDGKVGGFEQVQVLNAEVDSNFKFQTVDQLNVMI